MPSGASGPISPSSTAPTSAAAASAGVLLRQMAAVDGRADAPFDLGGQRTAIVLPGGIGIGVDRLRDHRPGEPAMRNARAPKRRDRGGQRRQRPRRGIGRAPHRLDLTLGNAFDQRADQFDLAGEIAIDRAGGDAGALRDRCDLHGRHAARGRRLARRLDDGVVAGVQPADDVLGAAIGHQDR